MTAKQTECFCLSTFRRSLVARPGIQRSSVTLGSNTIQSRHSLVPANSGPPGEQPLKRKERFFQQSFHVNPDHPLQFQGRTCGLEPQEPSCNWSLKNLPLSTYSSSIQYLALGYWHQRADERHGKPPPGNQELLVVRDKVGRPPGKPGVSKSMEYDIFPSLL